MVALDEKLRDDQGYLFILRGRWMSVPNFMAIHTKSMETFPTENMLAVQE